MKTSEFLRETARHIKKVGLNQNGGYYGGPEGFLTTTKRPACVIGAMKIVQAGLPYDLNVCSRTGMMARKAMSEDLRASGFSDSIFSFSDTAESEATVTRRLEKVARQLESRGQ